MLQQLIWVLSSSAAVMAIFFGVELIAGKVKKISANDLWIDLITFALPEMVIYPIVVFAVAAATAVLLPHGANALAGTPWWAQFAAFLIFEDMVNYWWHRAAHTYPKLMWSYHLAHHTPSYMSATITRRNGFFYALLFPNQYTAALLVYLGFGDVFVWYSAIKNIVLTGAHSDLRWDAFLYRYKILHPLAWIIERTISTPATHFAHHARYENDGIGTYYGNFSNLLFFWDVLFGTALISRQYPTEFGMPDDPMQGPMPWYVQLFYPIFRMRRSIKAADSSLGVLPAQVTK